MTRILTGLLAALALSSAAPALAGVYVVNHEGDAPDSAAGDGICDILPPGDPTPPVCTLRAAIMQANANADASTVHVPAGFHIVLAGALPQIVSPLEIRGTPVAEAADLAVIDGAGSFRPFHVLVTDVAIRNLRVVDGRADVIGSGGGAVFASALSSVLVENVQFLRNSAFNNALGGGAILSHGELHVVRSDFDMNATDGNGGAIYHRGAGTELMEIRDSSLRRSRTGASTREAVFVEAGAQLEFVNSLIDGSDNQPGATGSGGIVAVDAGRIEVRNATLVNFTRRALQGDLGPGSILRVHNSVLAGSDAGDCVVGDAAQGTVEFGYNLIEDGTCAIHSGANVVTGAPGLSLLMVDDGSVVRYRMPLEGGAAIDAAAPGLANACEPVDQRGTPRSLDDDGDGIARCDLGAVEGTDPSTRVFFVGTTTDSLDAAPGDGMCADSNGACSLRGAVMEANAKPGPDVIRIVSTDVALAHVETGGANGGDLDITESLVIEGAINAHGRPVTSVLQTVAARHFEVSAPADAHVVFRGLRLSGGRSSDLSGGSIRIEGGGTVDIDRVEFFGNESAPFGGAVSVVDGDLVVSRSDFHHNRTETSGAALYVGVDGQAIVTGSSFWANEDADALRDALFVSPGGSLLLRNSTVAFNQGGVTGHFAAAIEIEQSTIAFNEAHGIALFFDDGAAQNARLRSTIVAGNGLYDCGFLGAEFADLLDLDGWNLVQDGSACSAGATNVVADPMLAVAAGPTPLFQPNHQLSRVLLPA
ncbi:MAG TPA: right-handed parallel beta-helix repeat-containing protein, partial [Dokdonella sp.]